MVCQRTACRDPGVKNSSAQGVYDLHKTDVAFVPIALAVSAVLALFHFLKSNSGNVKYSVNAFHCMAVPRIYRGGVLIQKCVWA